MTTIPIQVPEADVETVRGLLRRSIATDQAELARLTMLSTAYGDHARGEGASAQLAQVRRKREVAQALLDQLEHLNPRPRRS